MAISSVADPQHHDGDHGPAFYCDSDPDTTFHFDADSDPTFNLMRIRILLRTLLDLDPTRLSLLHTRYLPKLLHVSIEIIFFHACARYRPNFGHTFDFT